MTIQDAVNSVNNAAALVKTAANQLDDVRNAQRDNQKIADDLAAKAGALRLQIASAEAQFQQAVNALNGLTSGGTN